MPLKERLRFGLIGMGRIGQLHAQNIAQKLHGVSLAAVADIDLPTAEQTAASLGVPTVVADYRRLLEDPAIDAVVVCSPTLTHAPISQEAAAAGKHIFCEKPIAHELEPIDRTLEAVARAGVKFQVGFNRRFDRNFRTARQMVSEGKIGVPHLLRITSRDPELPPIEYVKAGGMFLEMTVHDFDMARYLIGSEVREVYAAGAVMLDERLREAGDLDTAMITLRFENGVIGSIDNSRAAVYGYDQRVEVFGSAGMVSVANEPRDTHLYSNADGIHAPLPLYFFLERYAESYLAELRAFVDCIGNDTPPPVSGLDGRLAVAIGLAAQKSYEENRPVAPSEIG